MAAFLTAFINLAAQNTADIKIITLHSVVLNEDRIINIYSPPGAKDGGGNIKYPVLFLFDAESLFQPLVGAVNFMQYSSSLPQLPECYIVGITNTKRERDMPVPQNFQSTNGAKQFYTFLSTELLPFVKKHYQTSGLNVLIGHSQGGLFVTYAALRNTDLFPFVVALDAPIDVDSSLQKDLEQKMTGKCTLRYFSAETIFGWSKDFPADNSCMNFTKLKITGETHETMPYKGMYEGLKFLFKEHVPMKKDLSLTELQLYYQDLATKYGCVYNIPSAVLLNSASQKIGSSHKKDALALLNYHEKLYGHQLRAATLSEKASAITKDPDSRIDHYLKSSSPGEEAIKPFLGKWKGTVFVPGGNDMSVYYEIKKLNGKYTMTSRINDAFNSSADFLLVQDNQELHFGRIHNGGGIYLSIGKLSSDGTSLTGTEDLIGFDFPKDFPPFKMNRFEFKKLGE